MFTGDFKSSDFTLGIWKAVGTHARGCAHTQERSERAPNSPLWLTSRLCAKEGRSWGRAVKWLAKHWKHTTNVHSEPLSKDGDALGVHWRNCLCHYWHTSTLTKQRLPWPRMTMWTLQNCIRKATNQTVTMTTNNKSSKLWEEAAGVCCPGLPHSVNEYVWF